MIYTEKDGNWCKQDNIKKISAKYLIEKIISNNIDSVYHISITETRMYITLEVSSDSGFRYIYLDMEKFSQDVKHFISYLKENTDFLRVFSTIPVVECYLHLTNIRDVGFTREEMKESTRKFEPMLDLLFNNYLSPEDALRIHLGEF